MKEHIEIVSGFVTADSLRSKSGPQDIGRRIFSVCLVDENDIGFILDEFFEYSEAILFAEEECFSFETGMRVLEVIDKVVA